MSDLNDKKLSSAWIFFILNFVWTWLFWIPAAFLSHSAPAPLITALHFIGGVGPMLAALVLVYHAKDRYIKRDFWQRIFDVKRIKVRWYLVIFLLYPVLTLLPAMIDVLIDGQGIRPELASRFAQQPLMILPVTVFFLFFGPIPEELGWRGYALDRLQEKRTALVSSLILGAFWASWHVPLFFIKGTYHHNLGVGTTAFWIFILEPIIGSIFYTWIYNNTNRSTLSAILFHFMGNFLGELFELSEHAEIVQFILTLLFAVIVVAVWGPHRLRKQFNVDRNICQNEQSHLIKKIFRVGLIIILFFAIISGYFLVNLASFPGPVRQSEFSDQIQTSGSQSTFQGGVAYRHKNVVPMVEVAGNHYDMGLQYGVLLRTEILKSMESYTKILQWNAEKMGIPFPVFTAVAKRKAQQLSHKLPPRYLDEIKGISAGSGVSYDTILLISLFYDVYMAGGCTSVLMRSDNQTVIHGRNQDVGMFGGEELAKLYVVVRHRAEGSHAVTHMDPVLFLGVETGYNGQGITFSEETLSLRQTNPGGLSLPYLARMVLERSNDLESAYSILGKHARIGGYGTVWSDQRSGSGMVAELTPTATEKHNLTKPILWNFNCLYDAQLKNQQHPRTRLGSFNRDREAIAQAFPKKQKYTIEDAIAFLHAQTDSAGRDYAWCGTKVPICNNMCSQAVVFDPNGNGFYMALGIYFAAREDFYHYSNNFAKQPELYQKAIPVEPKVKAVASIENRLVSAQEKLRQLTGLAKRYPDDANIQFLVSYNAFWRGHMDAFNEYAKKAFSLHAKVPEYQLFAGLAFYHKTQFQKAIHLLNGLNAAELSPQYQIFRAAVLADMYRNIDADKSVHYQKQKTALIKNYGASSYFKTELQPRIEQLTLKR